jgi:hypothetical protein
MRKSWHVGACAIPSYRIVLEEQLAPLVLDVEKEAKDEDDVGEGDQTNDDQSAVDGHLAPCR